MRIWMTVVLVCVGCGGNADPVGGRWALHLDTPTLDGQPAAGVPPALDATMDLQVKGGEIAGSATLGAETATPYGQSYFEAGKQGCLIILPFASMTVEPFCESVSDNEMNGTAFIWGTHVPHYHFTARRR